MEQTLWCQSCSMPLANEEVWGSEANGNRTNEYCMYCYQNGAFTQPNLTMQEMLESCVPHMVKDGMEEQRAREILQGAMPYLKRWSASGEPTVSALIPEIVQLKAMTLAGLAVRTSNQAEQTAQAAIPQLWARYGQEQIGQQIAAAPEPGVVYGCYADYENGISGAYTVLAGQQVEENAAIPAEWTTLHLPASTYAVFTTARGPRTRVVIEAWQAIWRWQAETSFTRTYTGDFERYDERCINPEESQVDIYIAVAPIPSNLV